MTDLVSSKVNGGRARTRTPPLDQLPHQRSKWNMHDILKIFNQNKSIFFKELFIISFAFVILMFLWGVAV